jgi:hypothetical protein
VQRPFAAVHESLVGTFETCRPDLSMSVHRGRSEVTGEQSERRAGAFGSRRRGANDRFAPEAVDGCADLLVDMITTTAEAHRQAGDQHIRSERRWVDETAHKRWSRATDAGEFCRPDTFQELMELYGMKTDAVFGRIEARSPEYTRFPCCRP